VPLTDPRNVYEIAVLPGDGIGVDVIDATRPVLERVASRYGFAFRASTHPGGAIHYRDSGAALPDETFAAAREADAILFGAMGWPDIRYPDGTEIAPQLSLRVGLDLYAGVRPARAIPGMPGALADPRAAGIDFVLIRESTEGLFASRDTGTVEGDAVARDTMVITRGGTDRVVDFAFRLATRRKARGRPGSVTCVDKANVFRSMAFFRRVFDEVARRHPGISSGHHYVDATALDFVRRPWTFDVLVTENMFGDILSDLAAGLIGGMGMAPSADIGDAHGMFQPCHGSAPDIAGQGKANPTAALLSAALMLDWLGERHNDDRLMRGARAIEAAVDGAFADGGLRPFEIGGGHGTAAIRDAVLERL
jgi:3-isopropylmalate dehydrogenase